MEHPCQPRARAQCQRPCERTSAGHCGGGALAANPNPIADFRGSASGEEFGWAIDSGYDFNGDLIVDLVVGIPKAPHFSLGNAGKVRVFFGPLASASSPIELFQSSPQANEFTGRALAFLASFDDGSLSDLVVGSPSHSSSKGRAALFLGASNPSTSAAAVLTLSPQVDGDQFGFSAASAGDFNGDGKTDVILGAPGLDSSTFIGKAGLFLGENNPTSKTQSALFVGEDGYPDQSLGDRFGYSVAGGCDLTGDGYADVIIGAPNNDAIANQCGRAYVFAGSPNPDTVINAPSMAHAVLTGEAQGNWFGTEVAIIGDVNDDGYPDFAIGAPGHVNPTGSGKGSVYVYLGGPEHLTATPMPSARIDAWSQEIGLGWRIAGAGDVNHDGFDDILMSNTNPIATTDGFAFIVYGGDRFQPYDSQLGVVVLRAEDFAIDLFAGDSGEHERMGHDLALVGDVDGDDIADFAVSADQDVKQGGTTGAVYIWSSALHYADVSPESGLNFVSMQPYAAVSINYDLGDAQDKGDDLFVTFDEAELSDGQIYRNDGVVAGQLKVSHQSQAVFALGERPQPGSRGCAVADYDNDGRQDLFVADSSAPGLYRGHVVGGVEVLQKVAFSGADLSVAASWGDYDRDGWLDLFVVRNGAQPQVDRLFRSKVASGQGFEDVTSSAGLWTSASATSAASWVDVDQDGNLDLFVVSPESSADDTVFYLNVGGSFEDRTGAATGPALGEIPYANGVTFADLDNDLDLDVVVARSDPGTSAQNIMTCANDGAGRFGSEQVGGLVEAKNMNSIAVADYDLNGYVDIFGAAAESGSTALHASYQRPSGPLLTLERGARVGLSDAVSAGLAIYDHDGVGDVDQFQARSYSNTPQNVLFEAGRNAESSLPAASWLGIRLESAAALEEEDSGNNRLGIGARVRVRMPATGPAVLEHLRQAGMSAGRGGQDPHTLQFGFGEHVGDVLVRVTWPDGFVQQQTVAAASLNQVLTITETPHAPDFVAGSLQVYVQPKPNEQFDLCIEFKTLHNSDPNLLAVKIKKGLNNGPLCYEPPVDPGKDYLTLTSSYPGVITSVTPTGDGMYLNKIVLVDRPCASPCNYTALEPQDAMGIQAEIQTGLSKKATLSACLQ